MVSRRLDCPRKMKLHSVVRFIKVLVGWDSDFVKVAVEYGRLFLIVLFCLAAMTAIVFILHFLKK